MEPLETFTRKFSDPDDVWAPTGHSTCVADKAMGKCYGAAKKSKLVPVVMAGDGVAQIAEAFKEVIDDIKKDKESRNPVRYMNSVVLMSLSDGNANPTLEPWVSIKRYMSEIFDLGVPIVIAAGNHDPDLLRRDTSDQYPQAWAADDFPIIIVGYLDFDGSISEFSYSGPLVNTFAFGESITCVGPNNGGSGTSAGKIILYR